MSAASERVARSLERTVSRSLEAANAELKARVKELEREYVELLNRYPKPS